MAGPQDYVVLKLSAVAARAEVTVGTDVIGGTPLATDWIGGEITVRMPAQTVDDPTNTGSLDNAPPLITGIKPEITIRIPLRGTGVAGAPPEWADLMEACRFSELVKAAATDVSPAAATAGTTRTFTGPAAFATTDQAYRGMPVSLSGNPATPIIVPISDYTAGRVAKLPYEFAAALSTATMVQVLKNARYSPISDLGLVKPVTIYVYRNGLRHRFGGCIGTASLEMTSGQPAFITFTMRGSLLGAYEVAAMPTGWNVARPQAPIWLNGVSRLDGQLCNCARFTWDLGNAMVDPENPEAPQGFDPPLISEATQRITIDPFTNSTRSPTRFTKYRAGTSLDFAAVLGTVPGNRIAVVMPSGAIIGMDESNRNTLGVDQIQLAPNVPDAGVFVSVF